MVIKLLKNLLDDNAREVKKLSRTVEQINRLETEMEKLSDAELQAKTGEFKARLERGESLDDLLPEAFAVTREASRRVLGMRHFDVQLMGGIVLHQGRIAEMKTGEGKTLVATLPVYLNALTGQGVHVVTVNDYLARRDSEWMGRLYQFLGLSVGLIVHGLDYRQRQAAYAADVTYGTNNEFGFDYLRDNMAIHLDQLVQRELNYAIVDEVDSILIDEARTPLIISGEADKPTDLYYTIARIIPRLIKDTDYHVDEKAHVVTLTDEGMRKVERSLGINQLFEGDHMEVVHHVNQGLRAHALMKRDRDYVVKDGQVIIVDEFTGRLMFGRRYSEGLHQAIEAKEGVKIERESQTLATITFQNYFRMYQKLAGMTGTAATEEEEFRKIYGIDVVVIPTNMPMIREDLPDVIYRTEEGKFRAVGDQIDDCYRRGQPVLVGTISIEKSERLSQMLGKRGIPHQVLNAKHHEMEASIVAQAGRKGAVTIATNMAGRGTDILLGGNPEFLAQAELTRQIRTGSLKSDKTEAGGLTVDPREYQAILERIKKDTDAEHRAVVAAGGLRIIGTERHEARRIDNQLRGRSGRQGDPGVSQFFISLEDDLMRLFGSDAISGIMDRLGMDDSTPIEHSLISRSIENAQRRVESRNFDLRKNVLQYDDVMNQQREIIYAQRKQVLFGENLKETILDMLEKVIDATISTYAGESQYPEEWDLHSLLEFAEQCFLPGHQLQPADLQELSRAEVRDLFLNQAINYYEQREEELGSEQLREIERVVLLRVVDNKWMDHLDAMDQLRQGIGLRAYGQRDPLIEYKFEAYQMFQAMISSIQEDTIRWVFRARVAEPRRESVRRMVENRDAEEVRQPVRAENKTGRNAPCPCGSGKKYKKCCGR
ncbi:MAG: preprotein translocase subunit SecA [Syntrophomonadaceae bacterium]|nr:preprotein translocase subunit SecA [Syntrophomonadaceae bacterium]